MRSENGETTMTAIATITHDERALLLRMERCRRDVRHGAVQLRAGLLWPERLRRVSGGGRRRSGGQFLGRGAEFREGAFRQQGLCPAYALSCTSFSFGAARKNSLPIP